MKKRTWIIIISFILLVIVGGISGVFVLKDKARQAMSPQGPVAEITVVSKGDIKSGIYTSGTVRAADEREFPYEPIKEISFNVTNGQEVAKGKLLFEIEDPEASLQYDKAISERDAVQAAINQLRAMPASPEKSSQLSQKEMELKGAKMTIEQAAKRVEANKIFAPFAGIVTLSKDLPKKADGPGQSFVRLINPKKLIISVPIDEVDFPKVKVGDKVNVSLTAYEGETFTGSITYLGKEAFNEGGSVAFPATIALDPNEKVLPGMTADVSVVIAEKKNILLVPIEAVQEGEKGEKFVTLVSGENVREQRQVKTGIKNDSSIEIISGLKEGDQIEILAPETW